MSTPEEYVRRWVADHAPRMPGYDAEGTGTVMSAVDWLGRRFHVGDQVMYCISAGRGQMMAIGEVIKIESTPETREFWREPQPGEEPNDMAWDYTTNTRTKPVVKGSVPYDEIRVQVKTLKTSGRWDNKARTKPAWVNPMNITALSAVGIA